MIDIHSHIIFGVDDGPFKIEESIKMISEASEAGINTIIATPHFHREIFENENIIKNYTKLISKSKEFDVKILLGYEVFIDPLLPEILAEKNILCMNYSGYILLELPFDEIPGYTYEIIYKLQLLNITPVIAHPERNINLIKNFAAFLELSKRGCLMQLDSASIIGVYGRRVREFAKKIIKLNMAHFISSNAHNAEDYMNWYPHSYKTVKSWVGKEYADKLFAKNAAIIIDNIKEKTYEIM